MTGAPPSTSEVWLRGNLRPVLVAAVATACVAAGLMVTVFLAGVPSFERWLIAGFCAASALLLCALALAAVQPRLVHEGTVLKVRLAPGVVQAVPLAVVECFFIGSSLLEPDTPPRAEQITHRVGTLVMRVAERAAAWQTRPTFAPWGTWEDGAIVFDGRWCEPLSVELARQLSGKLVEAKRAEAAGRGHNSPEQPS